MYHCHLKVTVLKLVGFWGLLGCGMHITLTFRLVRLPLLQWNYCIFFVHIFPLVLLGKSKLDKCLAGRITTLQFSPKNLQGERLAIKSCCGSVDCYTQPEFCITHLAGVIYQNCRPDYLNTSLDKLLTWEAVAGRLAQAKGFVNLGEPTIPEK
jgi:hypothetical protein